MAAHAGVFSDLFVAFAGTANADTQSGSDDTNLQTLALPTPAMNINPAPAIGGGDITIVGGMAVMSEEGPSGTMADIEKPVNSTISIYTVEAGDTIDSVAQKKDIPVGILLSFNDITRDTQLQPGQQLAIVPTPRIKYTVKSGDTLDSIAKKTGGDAQEIALANGITNDTLVAGATIDVPNGETPAESPSSSPSSSSSESAPKPKSTPKTSPLAKIIPFANNPAEPAHNVGKAGTVAQVSYYIAPLAHCPGSGCVQTQGIHGYNAVDLAAPTGTSIRAAAAGVVTVARSGGWNGGYGSYVVISHANGSQTLYGHMSKVNVYDGEHVSQGQTIGLVGATGEATGPHVHFEIRNGIRNPF